MNPSPTTPDAPDPAPTAAAPATTPAPDPARGPNRWKIGVILAAIFACGVLVGGLGAVQWLQNGPRRQQQQDPARWSDQVMRQLDERLRLTPEQRERIAPLMRAGAEEARTARRQAFAEARGIIDRTHAQVAAELTDAQRPELERFLAERRRRTRRWMGPGPGEGGLPSQGPRP